MIYQEIAELNRTIVDCLEETDERKVLKAFTNLGIRILKASFGFVWLDSEVSSEWQLVYTSSSLPYRPKQPKKGGRNYRVFRSCVPDFVSHVRKRNDEYDVSRYMKSFVIIPISYRRKAYGNIVLCFTETEDFSNEKRVLCTSIGNTVAEAIAIRRLLAREHERAAFEKEKEKTAFIADATHELRTPLAVIKGNVDLALRSGPGSLTEAKKTLQAIDHEVMHLTLLIGDMAILTRSGSLTKERLAREKLDLPKLVERAAKRCSSLAKKKGISIRSSSLPAASISGDTIYLDRLFTNIIENALHYGKKGGYVSIGGALKGRQVEIEIRDDGIGIPSDSISHIFERFYRSEKARQKNPEGTGLGLAICKWIAEAHGGTLGVKSTEDRGSTFTITLPSSVGRTSSTSATIKKHWPASS